MKIEQIEVIPANYRTNENPQRVRSFALVKITTSDGVVGWGEASDSFGHATPLTLKAFVDEKLRFVLIGQDPRRLESLMWRVRQDANRYSGFRELTMQALSAVEIALWDIRGKLAGKSVSDLLGRFRDEVDLYASSNIAFTAESPADDQLEFNQAFLDQGVRNVKLRIGNTFEWDAAFVRAARLAFPANVRMMIDGKYNYTTDAAIRMSRILADNDIFWFEEPLPDHNLDEMARLTAASALPIAYGEHCFTVNDFRDLVMRKAALILQPDITICGGIGEAMKVTHFGETMGRMVVPHVAGLTAVGLAASLHFAAAMPRFLVFEWDSSPFQPLRDELPKEPIFATERIRDGCIAVPNGPGLGVEVNEDVLRQYAHRLHPDLLGSFPTYGTPRVI
jgi:L-alanine-DL-glutamate epimerase-like enolase superfamily enzyme